MQCPVSINDDYNLLSDLEELLDFLEGYNSDKERLVASLQRSGPNFQLPNATLQSIEPNKLLSLICSTMKNITAIIPISEWISRCIGRDKFTHWKVYPILG